MPWTYRNVTLVFYALVLIGAMYGCQSGHRPGADPQAVMAGLVGALVCGAAAALLGRVLLDALVALFEIRALLGKTTPPPPAPSSPVPSEPR